jgi:hypothetical protein
MSTSKTLAHQAGRRETRARLANHAVRAGRAARNSRPIDWIAILWRFGYIVRGLVYVLPGAVALRLAWHAQGSTIGQMGAIELIGRQPFGRVMLLTIAVGLGAYASWGVIRAVFDPLDEGHSPRGLARRLAFVGSAIFYGGLLFTTIQFLGGIMTADGSSQDWTKPLLGQLWGRWLVGAIGVAWIAGVGIGEIVFGWRGKFRKDLDLARMGTVERRWANGLGRFGSVARGVVFAIIGIFLVSAAVHASSERAHGMDRALLDLMRQPLGRWLLAAVSLGLIAFGLYSMMCARWMRVRFAGCNRPAHATRSHSM